MRLLHRRESALAPLYHALFFVAHANRRVWLPGCSPNPTGARVTQQARNLGLDIADQGTRLLIRDRDSKYTGPFDEALRAAGIQIVTPAPAPTANAIAERFVRTLRAECLDWLLILNRRHLERVLREYVEHYNTHRPHRALKMQPPQPREPPPTPTIGAIQRHDRLGGLITSTTEQPPEVRHDYWRPSRLASSRGSGRLRRAGADAQSGRTRPVSSKGARAGITGLSAEVLCPTRTVDLGR